MSENSPRTPIVSSSPTVCNHLNISMAPRVEQPRSPRGRALALEGLSGIPGTPSRPRSPFPALSASAPASAVACVSVETRLDSPRAPRARVSSLRASDRHSDALLSPPRPGLPTSKSTGSIASAASGQAKAKALGNVLAASVSASTSPRPDPAPLFSVDTVSVAASSDTSANASRGPSRTTSPAADALALASSSSPGTFPVSSPRTPRTPLSPRSPGSSSGPLPMRPPSRKGKERAAHEVEVDADAVGEVSRVGNARRGLRELVAKDEHRRERAASRAASSRDVTVLTVTDDERELPPRRYYVLTNAGKPVFSVNHADDDTLTNLMGVVQALVSIFAEEDDKLRSVVKGRTRIAFLLKPEMYLFAVSDWGEPEHVLRMHLEYINLQILSVVSASQLVRAFQRRSNFDLSRLLVGSEKFLYSLVERCQDDMSFMTTTLQPLRMPPALRETAAAALMPPAKFKDLLYVLLIAGGRIVTLLRPRRHAVHPSGKWLFGGTADTADMHLLLNTLATSAALRDVDTWLPICLPKFNPQGFVHAYVSFVRDDIGLVFISADKEAFEPLCGWRASVVEQLTKDGALDRISASIRAHPYTVAEIGSPGLRHFVYKSRGLTQITAPEWEDPYLPGTAARYRLVTLYQKAQDALFARPGTAQPVPLRLIYLAGTHEAVLAWLTRPFEMYIAVSPHLPMSAVVATANRVAKWVNSEESRLFLREAPVF